eukprot:15474196-Alexandrium_andersonii.AAC.1
MLVFRGGRAPTASRARRPELIEHRLHINACRQRASLLTATGVHRHLVDLLWRLWRGTRPPR